MERSAARRTVRLVAVAITLLCISATPAMAKVKVFLPENFQVAGGGDTWSKRPLGIQGGSFWAPVKLPIGSRFTKMVFYHWGYGDGSSSTWVYLNRTKMGDPSLAEDILLFDAETSYTGASTAVEPLEVAVTNPFQPTSDLVIRPGYRYYLLIISSSSIVPGVKVYYVEP